MELKAKKRTVSGKKVKALRREGVLPAVLFGGAEKSVPLELNLGEFRKIYTEAGESTLLDLEFDGKKEKILIAEVQHDPLGKFLHADLRRVAAGEKITAAVPVLVEGEAAPVKAGEAVLLTLMGEIEVECFPQDLPREIKLDVSGLTEIGSGISIAQLPIDQTKVAVPGHSPEELVVKLDYPQAEEVEEAPVTEEEAIAAVEATEEKPEGEEGAEGRPTEETGEIGEAEKEVGPKEPGAEAAQE